MTTNIENNNASSNRPTGGIVTKVLVVGALVAAFGGWWYQSTQVNSVRHELANQQQRMDQLRGQMDTSVAMAKAEVNRTVSRMNEEVSKAPAGRRRAYRQGAGRPPSSRPPR